MKNNNFKLDNNIIIQNLMYADDLVLISHNIEDLRYLVDLVADEFKKFGLKINMAKTKFIKVSASSALCDPVILRNIEQVKEFQYLGCMLSGDGKIDSEIELRLLKASLAFRCLYRLVCYQAKIKNNIQIRLFKSMVLPVLYMAVNPGRV